MEFVNSTGLSMDIIDKGRFIRKIKVGNDSFVSSGIITFLFSINIFSAS
jgi:hypothetical protein